MAQSSFPFRQRDSEHALRALHLHLNRLFEELQPLGRPAMSAIGTEWSPKVDVTDNENSVQLTAELPGVDEKDVTVTIDRNVLTVKGEKKSDSEQKDKQYYRFERTYGSFLRSFDLPEEIEHSKAEASFKNGVLTVTIPKSPKTQSSAKKIPVRAG